MKKPSYSSLRFVGTIAISGLALAFLTAAQTPTTGQKIGIVNFKTCLEGSKLGKKEQANFENIRKQLETTIDSKEKEINDLAPKFSAEYLDTLAPEAEAELKSKFQNLNKELQQLQNQYYTMLNQANYQIVHNLQDSMSQAAKKVSQAKGLDLAINEEICFYHLPTLDISKEVITEMDTQFDKEAPGEKK